MAMAESKGVADLLIRGGTVVDGSGEPGRSADVAVQGGRISAIGDLAKWAAGTVVEAAGLVVSPGFIDMHSHSDLSLLINPRAESKLRQGVTTEVIGQCGFSPAPAPEGRRGAVRAMFGGVAINEALEWSWATMAEYLEMLRRRGISVNVVPVVGHATLRNVAIGMDDRPAGPPELAFMQRLVQQAMEEGAFGISSGLVYTPSMFASTEELIDLAKVAAQQGGIYFTHIRGEADTVLSALDEATRIGRESGARVEVAHLKCEGARNWGRSDRVLENLLQARAEVDVRYDCYPYTAWNTGLAQLLPAWAREGGPEAMVARLCDPAERERVRRFLADSETQEPGRWTRRLLSSVESEDNRPLQGMTLAAIADLRMQPAEEVIMDLLVEEKGSAGMVGFGMRDDDVSRFVSSPLGTIGSDASALAPYGDLSRSHPHPRTYGTFARVLGHYVREERALTLEQAVHKMTGLPAQFLGLADRGLLAVGKAADIVVFDPATVSDRAVYERPHQYAAGIRGVIVNGVLELDGDKHLGHKPGRVLSKT
jgi:N-acyl-D-amino-acid deacylase